ncbi:MAG: acyl-CoA desaturase [Actinobacteria bacterium]|nr:acyl-CoA desaturase [Actinomycetota bacterium]
MSQAAPTIDRRPGPPPSEARVIPGIELLDARTLRIQRTVMLLATLFPFAGFVIAVVTLWGRGLSAVDAAIFLIFYFFTGLGVTIGFHRLETHGSFKAKRPLRALFAIAGSMSLQGSVISWVAAHRRHHAFSDQAGDPHSPHLEDDDSIKGIFKGLWHAHMGWLFDQEQTSHQRWAPDLVKDPLISKIDRSFAKLSIATFILPAVCGLVITRSWQGMVTAFLWGSLGRIFFLHHVTWSVNSICHYYGNRPFKSKDLSTNNWLLSVLSFGESWHNNHHAFPTSARHGIGKGQVDISARVISWLEKLRLVENVKLPSDKQLAAKRI